MKNRVYLVTGATGFLGSEVCRRLTQEGAQIRAFALENDEAVKYLPETVEIVYGDLCNEESLEKLFCGREDKEKIVLHIASIVTVNPDYSQKVMDVNVEGTRNVINLCKKYGVKN